MSRTKILQRSLLSLFITGLAVPLGCHKKEPTSSNPPVSIIPTTSTAAPRQSSPPTREAMQDHFKAVVLVRDALIAGNVDLTKWNASWIAERQPSPAIQSWSLYVDHLRERALAIVAGKTLDDVAHATASLGVECGNCHAANRVSLTIPRVDQRESASGTRPHMLRHQWAAEQMWIGLVTPSEATWNAGVAELAEAPLGQENILPNASVTPAIVQLAADVHAIGGEGARATTWEERAALYGRLVTTCASCHSVLPRAGG